MSNLNDSIRKLLSALKEEGDDLNAELKELKKEIETEIEDKK